ncbi:tail assembly protein [Vibrio phage VpKK5]|uniref:tail assembly chaperone n=1 Tax=Vibrio phage VpKK5 TaxID=1538804 RepID=UPI0004F5926B|nr:tail assembly chaperone [Vibrio phage VpKK5]AIM40625.1 tail assembly protein [Vibrio phage VpKK5]
MQITMSDVRRVHFCSRGARAFFERYGLDWNEFVKNGLPEEAILATGDQMGKDVVEAAWAARKNKQ